MKTTIFKKAPTPKQVLEILTGDILLDKAPYNIWPEPGNLVQVHSRIQDECDGDYEQVISITTETSGVLRFDHTCLFPAIFRHMFEGTASVRTGNALRLLWYAGFLNSTKTPRKNRRKVRIKEILRILETFWMPHEWITGEANPMQFIPHDYIKVTEQEGLQLIMSKESLRGGDISISQYKPRDKILQWETDETARSPISNALQVLALAIMLDNTVPCPDHDTYEY